MTAKAIEAQSAMIACEHGPQDESAVATPFAQEISEQSQSITEGEG